MPTAFSESTKLITLYKKESSDFIMLALIILLTDTKTGNIYSEIKLFKGLCTDNIYHSVIQHQEKLPFPGG